MLQSASVTFITVCERGNSDTAARFGDFTYNSGVICCPNEQGVTASVYKITA